MKKLVGATMAVLLLAFGSNAWARDVLTSQEKSAIMKEVKRDLKDPDSAKFKWPKLSRSVDMKAAEEAINYCAVMNAKNSYGGYVGERPFSVTLNWSKGKLSKHMLVTIFDDTATAYDICSGYGYDDF